MPSDKSAKEQIGVDLPEPQRIEPQEVEQQEPESTRPDWLPENFQSEQEFVASYKEAQNKIREQGESQRRLEMQLGQLQEAIEEGQSYRQEQQQFQGQPQSQQELREQLQVAFENDPIGTMAYLAQQYANQTVEQRLQSFQQESRGSQQQEAERQNQMMAMTVDRALGDRYPDWEQYKERVASEIENDRSLLPPEVLTSPESTMRQLARVYENVKARDVLEQHQNGNFVQHELNTMKQRAQTISGQGARPGEPNADDEHFARLKAAAKGMSYASWREG